MYTRSIPVINSEIPNGIALAKFQTMDIRPQESANNCECMKGFPVDVCQVSNMIMNTTSYTTESFNLSFILSNAFYG